MSRYSADRTTEPLPEHLACAICLGVLDSPVWFAACEHTFCDGCIRAWLTTHETCCVCAASRSTADLSPPPRLVRNMVNELELHCAHRARGCGLVVRLEHVAQHEASCAYRALDGHPELSIGQLVDEIAELRAHVHTLSTALGEVVGRLKLHAPHNPHFSEHGPKTLLLSFELRPDETPNTTFSADFNIAEVMRKYPDFVPTSTKQYPNMHPMYCEFMRFLAKCKERTLKGTLRRTTEALLGIKAKTAPPRERP